MLFSTFAVAALAGFASAQRVTVVSVSNSTNGLIFSPDNIKVSAGEMVQFQFRAGNHTVTQSNFDNPCQPLPSTANGTGFHSGYLPVAAGMSSGTIPTYTIMINNTNPIWIYCAQGRHCQNGMTMVINENTAANSSRSLTNYKALAASAATSTTPGGNAGGTTGSTTGASPSGTESTTPSSVGSLVQTSSALGLLAIAASLLLM